MFRGGFSDGLDLDGLDLDGLDLDGLDLDGLDLDGLDPDRVQAGPPVRRADAAPASRTGSGGFLDGARRLSGRAPDRPAA